MSTKTPSLESATGRRALRLWSRAASLRPAASPRPRLPRFVVVESRSPAAPVAGSGTRHDRSPPKPRRLPPRDGRTTDVLPLRDSGRCFGIKRDFRFAAVTPDSAPAVFGGTRSRCTSPRASAAGATTPCRSCTTTGWSGRPTPPPTARRPCCVCTAVHEDVPFTGTMTRSVQTELDDLASWLGLAEVEVGTSATASNRGRAGGRQLRQRRVR